MELFMFLEPGASSGRCSVSKRIWFWFYMSPMFQQWIQIDIFKKIWIRLLKEYDYKEGIKWMWQSLDSISIKSPIRRGDITGNNPIDRSKLGQAKRHILTDKNGILISVIITSANSHDIKAVIDVIDNSVIKRTFVTGKPKKG